MSEANAVESNRLVSQCESCRFNQFDYPTMEDPYGHPFCGKGHWSGCDGEKPKEDPWKDCKDFLSTNGKGKHE